MRRAALALLSTVAGLVLLLTFKTHAVPLPTPPAVLATSGTRAPSQAPTAGTSPTPLESPSPSGSTGGTTTGTVTGDAADTRYGPVQVQVTVKDGKIESVTATEYPTQGPRDQQINAYAIPALNSEAVAANGAGIDMISGATFTSEGYIASLQSALDQVRS